MKIIRMFQKWMSECYPPTVETILPDTMVTTLLFLWSVFPTVLQNLDDLHQKVLQKQAFC